MIVEVKGSNLSANLVQALRARGMEQGARRVYSVATTGYVASDVAAERLGQVESRREGGLVRDVAIAYLKKHGFPAAG